MCDGIRCDMAMLLCEDVSCRLKLHLLTELSVATFIADNRRQQVLEKTWGGRLAPFGQDRAQGEFWPPAIDAAKKLNPDFTFCAECYWDREYQLQTFVSILSRENVDPTRIQKYVERPSVLSGIRLLL